jgi:hypothetical protein
MFKKEEEKLVEYKNVFDNIEIPLDSIDGAIFAGFQKAKSEPKPRRKTWMLSIAAAAIILIGFFTSIRVSPAFADYIKVIPGMEKIVDLIRNDKGKMMAVENDYYEKIGVSQEINGTKFSINGAIADENGIVLFYSIHSEKEEEELMIDKADIKSVNGEKLDLGGSAIDSPQSAGKNSYQGTIEYYFQSPLKANKFEVNLTLKSKENYSFHFQLHNKIKVKKVYSINKIVNMEGQRFTILYADIYPLRVAVHIKMDPNNTKKLLDFENIRIVDGNGETWNKIANGVTASRISDDEVIIYLQSNYFSEPKHLYIVVDKIQAVDKNDAVVVVDTKKQQILKQPKGNYLTGVKVIGNTLEFELHTKDDFHYFPFSGIINGNGKKEIIKNSYSSTLEQKRLTTLGVDIEDLAKQTNPITLELSFYPSEIKGEKKIKIK